MYYCYVLYSQKLDQYYIGSTQDLKKRYHQHTHGGSKYTKQTSDWKLIYYEAYTSYRLAFNREYVLKPRSKSWKQVMKRILEDKR